MKPETQEILLNDLIQATVAVALDPNNMKTWEHFDILFLRVLAEMKGSEK